MNINKIKFMGFNIFERKVSRTIINTIFIFVSLFLFSDLNGQFSFSRSIVSGNDDVEEEGVDGTNNGPGSMYFNSSDLEIVRDIGYGNAGNQVIGLRFTNISIPQGATITNAYISFRAVSADSPNSNSEPTELTIKADNSDNASPFINSNGNVSSRPPSFWSTSWTPSNWSTGVNYITPSMVNIVQELVNRSGWATGNAMAFIITGTGSRSAYSYDGNATYAPKLYINYSLGSPLNLSVSSTNILCRNIATGSINLTVSGGNPPYTYDWSNDGPEDPDNDPKDLSGLTAGSYVVTVTDASGNSATRAETITQPLTNLSVNNLVTKVSTSGGNNGAIDLSVNGGSPNYTYNWSNSATTQDINGLIQGTYTVTVSDNNGCSNISSIFVDTYVSLSIANKQLYLSENLNLDRLNPGASPIDNSTALSSNLSNAPNGIIINNISTINTTSNSMINLSHNVGNLDNRLLLVGVSLRNNTVVTATFGGVNMALVGSQSYGFNSNVYIYSVANPNPGLSNIVITLNDIPTRGAVIGAIDFSGVNQSSPLGSFSSNIGQSSNPNISVNSNIGDLVFDVLSIRNSSSVTPGSGQTQNWNDVSNNITAASSVKSASSMATSMDWNTANDRWTLGGVAIKPAISVDVSTFTQGLALCNPLIIKSGNPITLNAYVNILNGNMTNNPNITAELKNGSNSIILLTNPSFNFTTNLLTWSGSLGSDITIPAGQFLSIKFTTLQSGVTFQLKFDSQSFPSKIEFPVSTFINIDSIRVYDNAFPNETIVNNISSLGNSYVRIYVSDPFGENDITSTNLTFLKPDMSSESILLQNGDVVDVTSCNKTYEYKWSNPGLLGNWNIIVLSNEGSEGVSHSQTINKTVVESTGPVVQNKHLYLSDPGQSLDRSDPVNTSDGTTSQTGILSSSGTNTTSFTMSSNLCSSLNIKANQAISLWTYVSISSGSMPANPNISAEVIYGSTTIINLTNPTYNNNILFWTSNLINDILVPSGELITIVYTIAQSGVSFTIDYDSNTKPSKLELPVSTYIDVLSFDVYDAAYPSGYIITNANNGSIVYMRAVVSDPFGYNDISSVNINVSPININDVASSVDFGGCTQTFEYEWTTPTAAGDYYLTATAKEGYENLVVDFAYTPFSLCPIVVNATVTSNPTCFVPNNGEISLNIVGGRSPYTYSWSFFDPMGSGQGDKINGLSAGQYTITVTGAGGCQGITSIEVLGPEDLFLETYANNTGDLCNDGSINLVMLTGSGNYSYFWSDGYYTEDRNNLVPGEYYVTITDEISGCQTYSYAEIFLGSPISADAFILHPSCNGLSDGILNLYPSGGTNSYSILWSDNSTASSRINLSVGTYTVTITDSGNCNSVFLYSLETNGFLSANESVTQPTCSSSGAINLNISGGQEPFQYSWADLSNGFNVKDRNGLEPGSYQVTIQDKNGCSIIKPFTLNVPVCDTSAFYVCTSSISETFSITPDPIASFYEWVVPQGALIVAGQGTNVVKVNWSGSEVNFGDICVRSFTNCGESPYICKPVYIQSFTPTISVLSNECDGKDLNLLATGGNNFKWTGPNNFKSTIQNPSISNSSALNSGLYHVIVSNTKGCSSSISSQILINSNPVISIATANASQCNEDNGLVDISISGGTAPFTYNWSNGEATQDLINVGIGAYQVTVTDQKSCSSIALSQVNNANGINTNIVKNNVTCFGLANGSATVNTASGSGVYLYQWSTGATTQSISNLPIGQYKVTVYDDDDGCYGVANVKIDGPSKLKIDYNSNPISCFGNMDGSITLNVFGGSAPYNFDWFDISGSSNPQDRTSLSSGLYQISVTDQNNCSASIGIYIDGVTDSLSIQLNSYNVNCFGGDNGWVDMDIQGGTKPYNILWSTGYDQADISGLSAGTYTVTVVDARSCSKTETIIIEQPSALSNFYTKTDVACSGGSTASIDLTTIGGQAPYTYIWSDGSSDEDLSNLPANSYFVKIIDDNSCSIYDTIIITESSPLVINPIVNNVNCFGSSDGSISISVTGGTGTIDYAWSNAQTSQNIIGLSPGNYLLTITDDNNCSITNSFLVGTPNAINIFSHIDSIKCFGSTDGSISLNVIGGSPTYSYLWSNGSTQNNISSLNVGSYLVTVTDVHSCTSTHTIELSNPTEISVNISKTDISCFEANNGTINLNILGGKQPYFVTWSSGHNTQNLSNLPSGNYIFTITDFNGCTKVDSIFIIQPSKMALTSNMIANCPSSSNGSISIIASGGTGTYSYSWSDIGLGSENRTSLASGTYNLIVSDLNGCTSAANFELTSLSLNPIAYSPTCGQTGDGTPITLSNAEAYPRPSGGDLNYSYNWNNASISPYLIGVDPGTYTVTVTSGACQAITSIIINGSPSCIKPIAVDDDYLTEMNIAFSGNVALNDSDPNNEYPLSVFPMEVLNPDYGIIVWNNTSDGAFTYTPALNYSGNFSLLYKICDTVRLCDYANLNITVDRPLIGAAKAILSEPINNGDGSFDLTYSIKVENFSLSTLKQIQIEEDLNSTFNNAVSFAVMSLTSPDLSVNYPGFNGNSNKNLLTGLDSLNTTQTGNVSLTVRVVPGSFRGPYLNHAIAKAVSLSNELVSDTSQNGIDCDPDFDQNPKNNNIATPFTFCPASVVQGATTVCIGATTQMQYYPQGTWISSNTAIATVDSSGVVKGVSAGVVTIVYNSGSCTSEPSVPITIIGKVGKIVGSPSLCVGSNSSLTPTTGGTWSSSNPSVASVTNSGIINALANGTANFIYTETSTNCISEATQNVTVSDSPMVSITGPNSICSGDTTYLSPSSGGIWSSSNTTVAIVDSSGAVLGLSQGSANFTFSLGPNCVSQPTDQINVFNSPNTFLSGEADICIGTTTQALPSSGGTWISNNPSVASINNSGLITGLSLGIASFTFTENNTGCTSTLSETIQVISKPIIGIVGPDSICAGLTTTLSPSSNGIWTSSNNSIASISNTGTVFGFSEGQATFIFQNNDTGCYSDPSLPITVLAKPNVSFSGPTSICAGTTTTLTPSTGGTWVSSNTNVAQITNAGLVNGILGGTANFTFTSDANGCTSNPSQTLTVKTKPIISITGATSICVGTTSNLSPSSGGVWTSSNASIASVNNQGIVAGVAQGMASFTYTSGSTGCSSNPSSNITVNISPVISMNGPSTICVGTDTNVLPSSGGVWSSSNSSVATVSNNGVVSGLSNGLVTLSFTSSTGCVSNSTLQVTVNGKPNVTINGSSNICIGTTASLTPSSGGTWTSLNPSIATITNSGIATGITVGTTSFYFIDSLTGCTSANSDPVTVNAKPATSLLGASVICEGGTTTFTPTVGGTWTSNQPSVATINNAGSVLGIGGGNTSFTFTQTSTGCQSNPTTQVTVNLKPITSIVGSNPICVGDTTRMTPNGGGTWSSTNPSVASISATGLVTGLTAGSLKFTFTSSSTSCVSNQSALIIVQSKPSVNITGNNTICQSGTTTLVPSSGGIWYSSDNNIAIITNGGVVTGINPGEATFTFVDSISGCTSNPSQAITVNQSAAVSNLGSNTICVGFMTSLSSTTDGSWTANNPSIASITSNGVVTGLSSGVAGFTFTQTSGNCSGSTAVIYISVNRCFTPDFNIVSVDSSVIGDVKINDFVPSETMYGNAPALVTAPNGSFATIAMNSDGTYSFSANKEGKYIYHVSVCVSGITMNCPFSELVIHVINNRTRGNKIITSPDIGVTYSNANPALYGNELLLNPIKNDLCINGKGCKLDSSNVSIFRLANFGNAVFNNLGVISYIPNPGFIGTDAFTYQVCVLGEPTNCDTSIVFIQVLDGGFTSLNRTTSNDDFFTTFQETTISGNVKLNDFDPEGDVQKITGVGSFSNPASIVGGQYYLDTLGNFTFIPNNGFTGRTAFVYQICDNNSNQTCSNSTAAIYVLGDLPMYIKVYLEGALLNNNNAKSSTNEPLMRDNLRNNPFTAQTYIPSTDPYTFATPLADFTPNYNHVGPGLNTRFHNIPSPENVFGISGQNAIVDWVFVELRSKLNNKTVIATRSGLLQRDGDIVDIDGFKPLQFPGVAADSFYIVVRHRNHLGAMTKLVPDNSVLDFRTNNTPIFDFGTSLSNGFDYSGLAMNSNLVPNYNALWAGDLDGDRKLKFVNPNDDQNILFFDVFAYPENQTGGANYNFGYGYLQGDFDLNGKSKFDNPDDDKNLLFGQILLYPLNAGFLSNFNFFIEQVPLAD